MDEILPLLTQQFSSGEEDSGEDQQLNTAFISLVEDSQSDSEKELVEGEEKVEAPENPWKGQGNPRMVALLTYSQADMKKVPSRRSFVKLVLEDLVEVKQYVCALEPHKNGGLHYHLGVKLEAPRRFMNILTNIYKKTGISIHLREWKTTYFDLYRYLTKTDEDHLLSEGHPPLSKAPRTAAATVARKRKASTEDKQEENVGKDAKKFKEPRMTNPEFAEMIRDFNIKDDDELCLIAKQKANEGEMALWRFVLQHPNPKQREDLINTVQKLQKAERKLERKSKTRVEILQEHLEQEHFASNQQECNGRWLPAALHILTKNGFSRPEFSKWVMDALKYGRGKNRNLYLMGGTNSGKTFLLSPLTQIFDAFTTPSEGTFNWVGVIDKEIIFLNDLRYDGNGVGDREVMPWQKMLNLLEGAPVNIAMPKNSHSKDYELTADIPVFATSDRRMTRIVGNREDKGETAQIDKRWLVKHLTRPLSDEEVDYTLVQCGRCFAELVLKS